MDDLTKSAFLNRPDLHVGTEGEFKGWRTWSRDNFETHNGPFWHRMDDDGRIHCIFRVENKRAGGSMIFLRGLLKSGERPLFTFSGTIKRVKRRVPAAAASAVK